MGRLFGIFFICFHTFTYAQEVIKGRVLDERGDGLSFCYITNVQSNLNTITDSVGVFSMSVDNLPIVLEFRHVKHESLIIRVDSMSFVQVLLDSKSYTLDEVEVISETLSSELRTDLKSITEVSSVFGENDVSKYIITLPGVSLISSFDAGFSVRGGATTENQFLVDGMKIADPRHMSTLVTSFDPYVFNSSQIYRSGFPVSYNGYLSSYIDMNTDYLSNEKTQGEISMGMVSSSAKISTMLGKEKKHAFKASARYSYLDLVSKVNEVSPSGQSIPKYKIFDYSMAYRGEIGETWNIKAFSILSQDRMPLELTSGDLHQMKWGSYSFGLTTLGAVGTRGFLKLGIGQGQQRSDYFLQDVNQQKQSSSLSNTNLLMEYDLNVSQNSSWGIGFKSERNNYAFENNSGKVSSNYIYNGYTSWGYYSHNFTSSIGVNLGKLSTVKSLGVSPRVKLNYKLNDLEVVLDYARTFQYEEYLPYFTIRTPVDIPVPLESHNKPAYADQLSAGIYSTYIKGLKLYLGSFYKEMRNLKEFTANSRLEIDDIEMLEGDGYAYGTELELSVELTKLTLRVNYTWVDTKRQFQEINEGAYYSPPFDISSSVTLNGAFNITSQLKFLVLWNYSSGVYITIPEGVAIAKDITNPASLVNYIPIYGDRYNYQLPARHRLDLTIEYTRSFKKDAIKFALGTYNTYNRKNPDFIFLDVEPVDEFFVSFVPKSKVVVPFIPYISLTYFVNYAR